VENQNGWYDWFYLNGMKRNALSRSGPAYYDKMRFKTFNDSRSQKKDLEDILLSTGRPLLRNGGVSLAKY